MLEDTVTTKDGREVRVVAASKEDLAAGVKAAKANDGLAETFDINVPVMKGHDLLSYGSDLNVEVVDGTGAHNSPRGAVNDDGSIQGSDPLLVVPSAAAANVAQLETKELVSDGELKDVDADKVETTSPRVGSSASA